MAQEWQYKLYGRVQYLYHQLRGRHAGKDYQVFFQYQTPAQISTKGLINGQKNAAEMPASKLCFMGDNILQGGEAISSQKPELLHLRSLKDVKAGPDRWLECIKQTEVGEGWLNTGYHLTAYIKEKKQWCLSNWIWTSAAIARVLSAEGMKDRAQRIADAYLRDQLPEGGWCVRYDFIDGKLHRLAAPNDSAYIARHSLLTTYTDTGDERYLKAAEKCADWIMSSSYEDGLVPFGYNVDDGTWIRERNIVDIGFTACLFAELYRLTSNERYHEYLKRFADAFVKTFYVPESGLFASHINGDRKRNGGYFSRGQAWAMEGMIDAYLVDKSPELYRILENVTKRVAQEQLPNGGWYCNLQKSRAMMGEDCKGISAIAMSLLRWSELSENKDLLRKAAEKAQKWCIDHTDAETGMILSFSCNGAIAHSLNTSTGILYAAAYAIEIDRLLAERA